MSYSFGKSIVTDGLVFYVDAGNSNSYPGSGTTWTDLVGSNDGTLYNTPTHVSDNGGAISFDGSNEGMQTNTASTLMEVPLTVDAWAKPQTTAADGTIVSDYTQSTEKFILWWDVGGTPNFRCLIRPTKTTLSVTSETASVGTVNQWNHVSVTADATTLKIYLNGVLQETVSGGGGRTGTSRVSIGSDYSGTGGSGGSRRLNGDIAAVKIYNRVLTADEVLQNYNALKSRFV